MPRLTRPGFCPSQEYGEYHDSPGLRASKLKGLRASSWSLHHAAEKESWSMDFGRLLHEYVLEPATFADRHVEAPAWEWGKGSKKGKAERAEFEVEHALGRNVVEREELENVRRCASGILSHPDARKLLGAGGYREVSIYWDDPEFGPSKARLDELVQLGGSLAVVDLKSSRHPGARTFASDAHTFGYALQGEWYLRGCRALGIDPTAFWIIAAQNCAPWECAVYRLDEDWLELARRELDALALRWTRETQRGEYKQAQQSAEVLSAPPWVERDVCALEDAVDIGQEEEN